MNVHVQRVLERYGLALDEADAVAFAEATLESWRRVLSVDFPGASVPEKRALNLALVFLQTKYPFQCCGKRSIPAEGEEWRDERCADCPGRPWSARAEKEHGT